MKKVVIFGTKDTAQLAKFYLESDSCYEPVAFTVNKEFLDEETFEGLPVVSFEKLIYEYPPKDFLLFAPMTGAKMNQVRKSVYLSGKSMGYDFASYVSSKATSFGNSIGENCFILEDNTIQPFTKIGNNVVLWSGNHIGHHSTIEDHVFFTSHCVMSGHCHIKERSWLGVNCTIRDYTTLAEGTLIAMGSLITKDTERDGFYMGVPARKQEKKSYEVY